jgi:hypothetical protein
LFLKLAKGFYFCILTSDFFNLLLVILSGTRSSRSELLVESKDPYTVTPRVLRGKKVDCHPSRSEISYSEYLVILSEAKDLCIYDDAG